MSVRMQAETLVDQTAVSRYMVGRRDHRRSRLRVNQPRKAAANGESECSHHQELPKLIRARPLLCEQDEQTSPRPNNEGHSCMDRGDQPEEQSANPPLARQQERYRNQRYVYADMAIAG